MRALLIASACVIAGCSDAIPPELELSTTYLDFGPVEIGSSGDVRQIELSNLGTSPLTLERFAFVSSSPELKLETAPFVSLAGGEKQLVRFSYTPTGATVVTATLTLAAPDVQVVRIHGIGATLGFRITHADEICGSQAGTLALGTSNGITAARKTVRIESTGTAPIRIIAQVEPQLAGLALDPPLFDRFIGAGSSEELTLVYDPRIPLAIDSALVLRSDSVVTPELRLPICADARFPAICVSPADLDFGVVAPGVARTGRLDVSNCGNEPLVISSAGLAQDMAHPSTPGFTVTSTAPVTLAPGVATPVQIELVPPTTDRSEASVLITSNAPRNGELFIPVIANAARACRVTVARAMLSLRSIVHTEDEVRITNDGGRDCVLRSLTLVQPSTDFSITRTPAIPTTIPPRSSIAFGVKYASASDKVARGRVELELDPELRVSVPITGDPAPPPGCFVGVSRTLVDFGLHEKNVSKTETVDVINHGSGPCQLIGATLDANTDRRFHLTKPTLPQTIESGGRRALIVDFSSSTNARASGLLTIETNDSAHHFLLVNLAAARLRCDDDCNCQPGETLTLWRFDALVGSSVEESGGHGAFHKSCDADRCEPGQVAVETARNTFDCTAEPPACDPGSQLDYDEREIEPALACVPCPLIVQYGGLYDFLRLCADEPNLSCSGGEVPTFDVTSRAWECKSECNNGAYDRHRTPTGRNVCVPC